MFKGDVDAFRQQFDSDRLGRQPVAKGHTLLRSIDNPNGMFVRVEFDSTADAKAFQHKVRDSHVSQNTTVA